jgi:hypothetical protein
VLAASPLEVDSNAAATAAYGSAAQAGRVGYLRVANEGVISLDPYPAVVRWLETVESLERFIPMKRSV